MGAHELEVHDNVITKVSNSLPYFEGKFDPYAYIDWELKVDAEFDNYDLSEHQMVLAAASTLTKDALIKWKYICRHDNVPKTWKDFKMHFRDVYIPEYYVDHLLSKLGKLKQGSKTVRQYFHDFKICIMFGGLEEYKEDNMSRFMKGLNSEIRTMLISKSYDNIGSLFWLAVSAEKKIMSSANTCKNDVIHNVQNVSTLHANQEQQIVEPIADLTLPHDELFVVSCDKEDFCADSFTPMLQVMNKCDTFASDLYKCADNKLLHPITCAQDELKLLSSLNTLGYIEFDIPCDLSCLEEKLFACSELRCLSNHTYHFVGKNNSKGEYFVHKVYICSNTKSPFGAQYHDEILSCSNTNNLLQSFPSFSLMQQVQHKEGEHCSLWPHIVVAPYSHIQPHTFKCHWSKSRTTCSQEGENDEDITSSDMTILMSHKQKVNQSYVVIIIATFDELLLRRNVCSLSFSEINTWIKKSVKHTWKAWRTKEVDWGPNPSVPTSTTRPPRHFCPKEGKRSNPTRFGKAGFGLQESAELRRPPRAHTDSDWDVQILPRTVRKSIFIWIRNHINISSESSAIFNLLPRPFLPTVLRHQILVLRAVYHVGPNRGAS